MERFDEETIRLGLGTLSHRGRVVFCAAVTARLVPNFSEFCRQTGVSGSPVLAEALAVVWSWVDGIDVSRKRLDALVESSESRCPDPGEFETVLASSALDAGLAVANTVRLVLDDDSDLALEVACQARDTVDMFAQESEGMRERGRSLEERIAQHPLMRDEVAFQYGMLTSLVALEQQGFDRALREPSRSNLGFLP